MFLRAQVRKKDGKPHRYFSVVENRRVGQNKTAQRTLLYLGEINDSQEVIWRRTLPVFDESQQQYRTVSLFPQDREIPAESSNSIQVKLSEMGIASATSLRQLLVGVRAVAATAAGGILGREISREGETRNHIVGEGTATAGGESID